MFDGNQVLGSSGTVKQCFYDSYKNMLSSNFKIGAFKTGVATAGITVKNVLTNQNEDECKQQKKEISDAEQIHKKVIQFFEKKGVEMQEESEDVIVDEKE